MSYSLSGKDQIARLAATYLEEMRLIVAAAKAKYEAAQEAERKAGAEYFGSGLLVPRAVQLGTERPRRGVLANVQHQQPARAVG